MLYLAISSLGERVEGEEGKGRFIYTTASVDSSDMGPVSVAVSLLTLVRTGHSLPVLPVPEPRNPLLLRLTPLPFHV